MELDYLLKLRAFIKRRTINLSMNPYQFNVNGLIAWQESETNRQVVALPNIPVGIVYHELTEHTINVYPYLFGQTIESIDFYRHTDLHKPKTEQDFLLKTSRLAQEMSEITGGYVPPYYIEQYYSAFNNWYRYIIHPYQHKPAYTRKPTAS